LSPKKEIKKAYWALVATSILWGTSWIASKIAVTDMPALQVSYIRQFCAGSLFLLYFFIFDRQPLPSLKLFRHMTVMAFLVFLLANGLSTWGLKYIPTGLASLIGALYPLCVVLIEWIFFKKRNVTPLTFIGLIIGILGVGYVFYENMLGQLTPQLVFGLVLSIVAILAWSLGTIFLSRHHLDINPYYAMGWQMIIGSVMVFVLAHIVQQPVPLSAVTSKSWFSICYLVLVGSTFSFIAFLYTIKWLPSAIASLYAYVNPIVATIIASFLLDEKISITIMIGTVITLIGVYLVNRSVKKEKEEMVIEAEI